MKQLLLPLLVFLSTSILAQRITYNHLVDSADVETKEIIALFEGYLLSNPEKKGKNPFWNSEEQKKHAYFDFLEDEFQPSLYMGFPVHVLSIKFADSVCQIKAQFSYCKDNGTPYVLAIVNYVAKKENGAYKLYNSLGFNRQNWRSKTVGIAEFYYPPHHDFQEDKAKLLNDFIEQVCTNFRVEPTPFEYYLANDYDEIQQLKGIDYYIGMGGKLKPSGKTSNGIVYCGGLGEYYPHEVFHVLTDSHYTDKHFWVSEGVATFLGGSRGKSLGWHMERANRYLQQHPEIDLTNMLKLTNLDSETSYHYVLGGLIAKKVFDKGGWDALKEFMSSGESDGDYYKAIEIFLGVKRTDLNLYLRDQLQVQYKE